MVYFERWSDWIAAGALAVAFILTFWRKRPAFWLAAILYSLGMLVSIGAIAWKWWMAAWMAYDFSIGDAGSANSAILAWLALPIGALVCATAAAILLWPGVSQSKALRFGKILHLIILPVFISIIFAISFLNFHGQLLPELKWLVYGPLWFRIRESYHS